MRESDESNQANGNKQTNTPANTAAAAPPTTFPSFLDPEPTEATTSTPVTSQSRTVSSSRGASAQYGGLFMDQSDSVDNASQSVRAESDGDAPTGSRSPGGAIDMFFATPTSSSEPPADFIFASSGVDLRPGALVTLVSCTSGNTAAIFSGPMTSIASTSTVRISPMICHPGPCAAGRDGSLLQTGEVKTSNSSAVPPQAHSSSDAVSESSAGPSTGLAADDSDVEVLSVRTR